MYKCLCCGCHTLHMPAENAVAYICPVCMWENDVFIKSDEEPSDENHGLTLRQGRQNYREHGVCDIRLRKHARLPTEEERTGLRKLTHLGTKVLESDRLMLRPFTQADRDAVYHNWASDPEVTKYLTWPHHTSPEVTAEILKDWTSRYVQPDFYQWAIVPKDQGEPIGSISAVRHNDQIGKATIGYCIGKSWWRQGITSEALGLVIDFLIGEVGYSRIESWHDGNNPNSGAVMRKCGMKYEGTLRQADWNNQGVCDICMHAILAWEWQSAKTGKADRNDEIM